jgi:hypothetical protein
LANAGFRARYDVVAQKGLHFDYGRKNDVDGTMLCLTISMDSVVRRLNNVRSYFQHIDALG